MCKHDIHNIFFSAYAGLQMVIFIFTFCVNLHEKRMYPLNV